MMIGIDASRANSEHRTGTEWFSYHVIQELKRIIPNEYQVVLYSKEPLRDALADLPSHWRSRVLRWPPQRLWTQMRLSLEMLFAPPDLLYIPSHTLPVIHPAQVVTVIHDVGFERLPELYGKSERAYHRFAVRFALKYASEIITVSAFTKKEIMDVYRVSGEQIHVIPNGLNAARQSTPVHRNADTPYFFYLGRLERKKNTSRLVKAFAAFKKQYTKPMRLILAGARGYGSDEVDAMIQQEGMEDDVRIMGWTPEKDVRVLLEQAQAFVFPSLYEGFGIPLLEAMQAGVPVLASDIPALREVADDAALFFDPASVASIAHALQQMAENSTLRTQCIERGKKRAAQFSWKKTAEQTWQRLQHYVIS